MLTSAGSSMRRRSSRKWKVYEVEGGQWARARIGITQRGTLRVLARVARTGARFRGVRGWRLEVQVSEWHVPLLYPINPEVLDNMTFWRVHRYEPPLRIHCVVVQ